jgi:hypothetical protein
MMLIQIPIFMHFDCSSIFNLRSAADSRVFTLRYDTEADLNRHAEWTDHYPPRPNAHWIADEQGVFFDLFTSRGDKEITRRAEQDPETYQIKESV